jgi:NAD(P)-dependent dehydrogenase (short-subunit alcohol dehydrogenase family)
MAKKVWFITGSSRGFGRHWAEAALQRGDLVAATARDTSSLTRLVETYGDAVLPLQLDVTDQVAARDTVAQTRKTFGRLDVVVNNAGYGLAGELEEVSEEQARAQMETNFFGALWITQAVLPYMLEQGSGHIVQVSSIGGICTYPGFSLYHASKWALEGMSESLAQEVAGFGIQVTLVEPGPFATDWAGSSLVWADSLPAYATVDEAFRNDMADTSNAGDPAATSKAILALVDAATPPLRLFLGVGMLDLARATYAQRLKIWEQWEEVARAAQGN